MRKFVWATFTFLVVYPTASAGAYIFGEVRTGTQPAESMRMQDYEIDLKQPVGKSYGQRDQKNPQQDVRKNAFQQKNRDDSTLRRDTAAVELQEVTVQGRTQRVVKYGVEYTPDKRTKKTAMDATGLLELMQIPQLSVRAGSADVKTLSGQGVSIFIDYVPATANDLEGLRTEDVRKVEVLEYPQDPRFNSAPYVVNFIMQKYEWGGYTKLTADGRTLSNDYGSGHIYSKFNYKKWTFDASVGGMDSHATRDRSTSTATFRDIEVDGSTYERIDRESAIKDYFNQSNSQWVSVRAAYRKEGLYAEHTVRFNRNATPTGRSLSTVEFSPRLFAGSQAINMLTSQTLNPSASGYYFIQLPRQNSLNISWSFDYGSTNSGSFYQLGDLAPIVNNNNEKIYSPTANVSYSKGLGHNNTFRAALMTFNTIYDTYYSGSRADHQKLLSSENMLFLEYMQNWKFGLSLYSRVGGSYVIGRVNGVNVLQQFNPRLGFQLQYTINPKHRASFEGWWGNGHPSASTSNGALTQSNELLWIQGNPDLRNVLFATLQGGYSFVPTNQFSLSANIRYEGNPNKMAYEFRRLPGIDGLVRRLINSGDAHQYSAYVGANLTLFNKALALHAEGSVVRMVLTGCDAQSHTIPSGYVHARYQSNHWSVQLSYQTPGKSIGAYTYGMLTRTPCFYALSVNYAARNFKVALRFDNWFRTNGYAIRYFTSPSYDMNSTTWSNAYSRNINLTVSYTFTYGKKLKQNNELQKGGGVDSAILK